jgi:hypothetical protein
MMGYAIEDFWIHRLTGVIPPPTRPTLAGWFIEATRNPSFVEAELRLREGYDDLTVPIWLVAAPGAVGKSTLAKEISARTGAVYLDLAKADTVAGNYLTGGLVKNDLLALWQAQNTTILIDALDEARLRVTQSSFEDFLKDMAGLGLKRTLPIVLFGRVGIIEEAWLALSDAGLNCPVFDIDFFDTARANRFVVAALERLAKKAGYEAFAASLGTHSAVYSDAAARLVSGLEKASGADGNRFAGYAPVLEAVATVLAGVSNPAKLNDTVQQAMQGKILQQLADQVLEREAAKLRAQLPNVIPGNVKETLYAPREQLDRLIALVLGTVAPPLPTTLAQHHLAFYDTAVKNFVPQHPFLDGTGHQPSGAVFAAVLIAQALFSASSETVTGAEKQAGNGPHTPNPFLIDFYLGHASQKWGDNPVIPPEHVILLYESVKARAAVGDIVQLTIEGEEENDEADAEIQVVGAETRVSDRPNRIRFRTSQAGVLRFGRQVNSVSVEAPHLDVIIGSGNPVEVIPPVSLNIARLSFNCSELVVQRGDNALQSDDAAVMIEAQRLLESKVASAPLVRKGTELSVSWPGAYSYPWTSFATDSNRAEEQHIEPALRSLRRLVLAFRSHSKGRLARFQDKIEHVRITKGPGEAIRRRMMRDGILSLEGNMYFLDPDVLGRIAGATYQDLKLKRFNQTVRQYVASIGP